MALVFDPALGMVDDQTGETLNGPNTAGDLAAFQQYQAGNGPTEGTVKAQPIAGAAGGTGTAPSQESLDRAAAAEASRRSAKATITDALRQYGLEGLTDWAYGLVLDDLSAPEILIKLRDQQAYKDRFVANDYRQKAGLNLLTESQIVSYENAFRQTLREWGVPASLYDSTGEIAKFIGNDLSVPEVSDRIQTGYAKVTQNPDLRSTFRDWYGPDGDTALALYFMDTDRAMPLLQKQVGAATLGSTAVRYGVTMSQQRAEDFLAKGVNVDMAPQAFGKLGQLAPLFSETVSETQDLKPEEEGLNYVFGTDSAAETILKSRLNERNAAFQGAGEARIGRDSTAFASTK